jgi:serine/threonine protein kinase
VAAFLAEARMAAALKHPGIVTIYDLGRLDDGGCFVEMEYIEGRSLADEINAKRFAVERAARLIEEVADAVHDAHKQGLVHRDLKPANILLDRSGRPHVVDFGLAIHEQQQPFRRGERSGTPAYMAPEQIRGESHRLDGRTDIWSLGVMLYELLVKRQPFTGHSSDDLFDEIERRDPKPPRQIDDAIPAQLERICLKCLAKRMSDRYLTAADLAADLKHYRKAPGAPRATESAVPVSTPEGGKVVPKGLRSFDAQDAEFFLQLLPGATDREGLPDSLRFWKTRIEQTDADATFSVGLIYGPSGCGKSSLMKAGLLPRLASHVLPVYLEATADDTESRLLKRLRKQCPDLAADNLLEAIAEQRAGRGFASGHKLLIVLDQFERWLHMHHNPEATELVLALRQCDGAHVQSIVMVRDDFWMAASRFLQALEIPLLEHSNSASVDLFDTRHSQCVLTLFGRAYGCLPQSGDPTLEESQFIDQAVAELAEDGKVVSVRLALFAEMVKGKRWTPATLKEVGGIARVGVTFLEETFSATTAPPRHRFHQNAARAVLKALLPDAGTEIKGHRRSHDELLAASGYSRRPADFADLIRILDSELRLVTPADEEGSGFGVQSSEFRKRC